MQEFFYSKIGIYYRKNNFSPERKTLVFIHGLSGSSSAWLKYEEKFGGGYNILSFDIRGHGKSMRPRYYVDYEIKNFADDLRALLDYLHIEKCILIVHSFGTLVALEYILTNQQKVSAVVFLAVNFGVTKLSYVKTIKPWLWLATATLSLWPFLSRPGGHVDYSKYSNTPDLDTKRIFADVWNTGLRSYLYCLRHTFEFKHDDWWSELKLPVLLIHGRNDSYIPLKSAVALSRQIKNAELAIIENANHILVLNNFSEVSEDILEFVKKTAVNI